MQAQFLEIILPKPLHWTYENTDAQRSQVIPEIQEDHGQLAAKSGQESGCPDIIWGSF